MKKITSIICASLAVGLGMTAFSGCFLFPEKAEAEQKVMNVSLNPKVEFVLDGEDKVVTVNALNEEGNLIISAATFEGKSAEEAAKLFVEISTETGYLVSGSASIGDNQISISFSGDTEAAKALYEDVKAKMEEAFSAENVTARVEQAKAITEAEIKALIAECAPYIETAEMEYKELLATLIEERRETAEYYSQELKNAYYEQKEFIMQQAEIETLKSHLNVISEAVVDGLNTIYVGLVESIESTRMSLLVSEDSLYQKALAAFRKVKAEYLKARYEFANENASVTVAITEEQLAAIKARVDEAEEALLQAGVRANEQLDTLKAKLTEAYEKVIAKIEESSVKVNEHLDEINVKQQEKKQAFFTAFETKYAEAEEAARQHWNDMLKELEGSEEAAQ